MCLLYTARIIYQRKGALLFRKCYIRGQSTRSSRSYLEVLFPEFRVPRLPPLKLECGRCPGAIKKSGTSPAAALFLQMPKSRFAKLGWWVPVLPLRMTHSSARFPISRCPVLALFSPLQTSRVSRLPILRGHPFCLTSFACYDRVKVEMFLQNEGLGDFSSPAVLAHPLRVHRRSLLPRLALNAAEEKDLSHVPRARPSA